MVVVVCVVVRRYHATEFCFDDEPSLEGFEEQQQQQQQQHHQQQHPHQLLPAVEVKVERLLLDETSKRNDEWDDFNHPRRRRALILQELYQRRNTRMRAQNNKNLNNDDAH